VTSADREARSDQPVSLWWAALDAPESAALTHELTAALSSEEERRAERLERSLDRARFRLARGWLRGLLAAELACAPAEVSFVVDESGKPRVAGTNLQFSAARTQGVALYALSWRMELGVDVEAIRAPTELEGIAARFFTGAEQQALAALAPERRVRATYECWTRKEAYVKGIGAGLSFPLSTVEAWSADGGKATVGEWSIHGVDLGPGLAAAVAGCDPGDWRPRAPSRLTASGPGAPH
jgi:4'-phosphopantetheinyl transferase